jgi:hypothetical protein
MCGAWDGQGLRPRAALCKKQKGVIAHPPNRGRRRPYLFFFGAAFFFFFIAFIPPLKRFRVICRRLAPSAHERDGEVNSTPPLPWAPYFFFFVAFLDDFFFAGIPEIPPFGPGLDAERTPLQHLGY